MELLQFAKIFAIAFFLFILLDSIWLGIVTKDFYKKEMKSVANYKANGNLSVNWIAAIITYIILSIGIAVLVSPILPAGWFDMRIMLKGMIFGLAAYGVYDFTNYALLREWSLKLTLVDLCWGISVCTIVSILAAIIHKATMIH